MNLILFRESHNYVVYTRTCNNVKFYFPVEIELTGSVYHYFNVKRFSFGVG